NRVIKHASKVVTTTSINKNNYMKLFKKFNEYKYKFEVIYNTAGKLFDNYNENKRMELRKNFNIKENQFIIGFCGRYNEQKNWELTFDIIRGSEQNDNIKYLIVLGTDGTLDNYYDASNYLKKIKDKVGDNRMIGFINISNKE